MRHSAAALLLIASLSFAACSKDATGNDDDDNDGGGGGAALSEQEALIVTAALFNEVALALSDADYGVRAAGQIEGSGIVMPTFTMNGQCSQGGTISGSGTYTETTYDFTYTPNNCKVTGGSKTYTVNGDPNIKMHMSYPSSGSTYSYSMIGGFKWSGGSCKIDFTETYNINTGHGTLSGTMCGNSVNDSF